MKIILRESIILLFVNKNLLLLNYQFFAKNNNSLFIFTFFFILTSLFTLFLFFHHISNPNFPLTAPSFSISITFTLFFFSLFSVPFSFSISYIPSVCFFILSRPHPSLPFSQIISHAFAFSVSLFLFRSLAPSFFPSLSLSLSLCLSPSLFLALSLCPTKCTVYISTDL